MPNRFPVPSAPKRQPVHEPQWPVCVYCHTEGSHNKIYIDNWKTKTTGSIHVDCYETYKREHYSEDYQ